MKNLKFYVAIMALGMLCVNCTNQEDPIPEPDQKNQDLNEVKEITQELMGEWILNDLVNVSDEQKYVNTILEFKNDNTYGNSDSDLKPIGEGDWSVVDKDSIQLTPGIFENETMIYSIEMNSTDSLTLKYHYTLDNKDAIIEYHYSRVVAIPI